MQRISSLIAFTLVLLAAHFVATDARAANALGRDSDPVILLGTDLPTLIGSAPGHIVAFRYEAGWAQIPVQVDERAVNDYGVVYDSLPVGLTTLAYADSGTFMGADPDPGFDGDDELVFMAKDAGAAAPPGTADPAGAVFGSRLEVKITDPLTLQNAFVYLFRSDGSLAPDAGVDYVTYSFNLASGSYLDTYSTLTGPNPEDSEIVTSYYRTHFSDRWIRDEVNVFAGGAPGVDLLDRHKNLFAPTNCARSEDSFSNGEGAFFANRDGPVRAIRSYMGANSGPLTQRDHFFYERRHDVRTHLRVHPIPGVMDFYDYSPAASGLVYYNDLNTGGALIDGVSTDSVLPGSIVWEMVTGAQGTLIHAHSTSTNIPGFGYTSYYLDQAPTPVIQCTGDDSAYGSSGLWITEAIPNTDPALGAQYFLVSERVVYAEAPDQPVSLAGERYAQAINPLQTTVIVPTAVAGPIARGHRLSQNYPNPFARGTSIEFASPASVRATVEVFDVTGRLVKTLYDGYGAARVLSWDGRDAAGRRVASGIYFYRLKTPHLSQTRKMVILD